VGKRALPNKEDYRNYIDVFLAQNVKLNLISKNDEGMLWEKHICDSFAIGKFFESKPDILASSNLSLLDIGTGGGFPAVPIAIAYPQIEVWALDSIRKKINAIEEIKEELGLKNLHPICDRAENLERKFNIITSRAVAPLEKLIGYAMPLLKPGGYFIAYKSVRAQEEIAQASRALKKHRARVVDTIEYDLPLLENHTRKLIIIGVEWLKS
jgi:16S rRNA (guanine527-N7)-methyltransferase